MALRPAWEPQEQVSEREPRQDELAADFVSLGGQAGEQASSSSLPQEPSAGRAGLACSPPPSVYPVAGLRKAFLTFLEFAQGWLPVANTYSRSHASPKNVGMSASSTTLVGVVVAILIIGAVASIGYYQFEVAPNQTGSTTVTSSTSTCTPSTCVNVTIYTGAATLAPGFSPAIITIVIGQNGTIVWLNNDTSGGGVPHTVTPTDNLAGWPVAQGSGTLNLGDTYTWTFTAAGTYYYLCTFHSSVMRGTVIVLA